MRLPNNSIVVAVAGKVGSIALMVVKGIFVLEPNVSIQMIVPAGMNATPVVNVSEKMWANLVVAILVAVGTRVSVVSV